VTVTKCPDPAVTWVREPSLDPSRQDPTYGIGDKVVVDKDMLYAAHEVAEANCKASRTPLIKVLSVEPLTINGFPALYYSYKRKGWEGQPPVVVNVR
jgi:hypothetical protein